MRHKGFGTHIDHFASLILLTGLTVPGRATDEIRTYTKRFPVITPAPTELPKQDYGNAAKKWGIGAWWSHTQGKGNGFEIAIASPEVIAGITNREAKELLLDKPAAQARYEENLRRFAGDRLAFFGYIRLVSPDYQVVDMTRAQWTFVLVDSDGKRYKPKDITISRPKVELDNHAIYYWSGVDLIFENKDPDTGKPLLDPSTKSLTVMMGSRPGQVQARYEFDSRKK